MHLLSGPRQSAWNPAVHVGTKPLLAPGESILRPAKYVWLAVANAWPYTFRIEFPLPPLTHAELYVTDRRLIISSVFFYLANVQFSQWYTDPPTGQDDQITSVSTGRGWFGAPYIQVESRTAEKVPLRSRELRLRIYTRDAVGLEKLIQMARGD